MYNKKQFEKVCNGYLTRLTYAKFLCDIHYSCYSKIEMYNDKLKIAPNFFEVSFKAILHQALLTSANFYLYGQSNEFTLQKLLKILESDSCIRRGSNIKELDETIRQSREYLNSREDIIKRLIEWRNRYIAHNDKKYFIDQYKIDSEAININELIELISFGVKIIFNIGRIINIELSFDDAKYINDFPLLIENISEDGSGAKKTE